MEDVNEGPQEEERDAYLLSGRRVLISDLMKSGLLQAGDELVFVRRRLGNTYHSTVTEDAKLRLPDGRSYASPSRAAGVVAGSSIDGWHAWQKAPDGEFLDTLRQSLLDRVARIQQSREDGQRVGAGQWQSNFGFLQMAKEQARQGVPVQIRVRDLLARWNADGRTQAASEQIAADIENHGLTTEPSFLKTGLDTVVTVLERELEAKTDTRVGPRVPEGEGDQETGLTLGNIPSANNGVEAITPQATYEQAVTIMLLNDFSQLAVMAGPRSTPSAVTWQSIARERHANPQGLLTGAIIEATTVSFEMELIDVLPVLEAEDFVFVKDSRNLISGIVTTADVVRSYGQLATPFLLVGELDRLLRRVIMDSFTLDEVRNTIDRDGVRNLQSYNQLTMSDYQRILENRAYWETLGWPLDRSTFTKRLSDLRETRNDLVHFNPDPIPEDAVDKIRNMIRMLRKYAF